MRSSTPLLIGTLLTMACIAPNARGQSVTSPSASAPPPASQAAVQPSAAASTASVHDPEAAHPARPAHKRKAAAAHVAATTAHPSAAAGAAGGVLSLGATDITGNKELPKVMVIVPWKDSLGASGVIKPTDSLLDDVLQPVDRGVFQRQVRYYGQLAAAPGPPAAARVAPVGDSH
jgi:hypothetical protein